jgi:GNAT superfamily N-acetyltransferase
MESLQKEISDWLSKPLAGFGSDQYSFGDNNLIIAVELQKARYGLREDSLPKKFNTIHGIIVKTIFVNLDKRRKGHATRLLQFLKQEVLKHGFDYVLVQSVTSNSMVKLLQKEGTFKSRESSPSDYVWFRPS